MNIINQYEQGYIDRNTFLEQFPDSISESQECLFGSKCIQFYISMVLCRHDLDFYIQKYDSD